MRPVNVQSTLLALSAPRLSNYTSYFNVKDDHDLYSCYQWNNEASRSFLSLIHLIEVSLRNAYHRELSTYYSNNISGKVIKSFPWYDHANLKGKSLSEIKKATAKTNRPDDVISRQTFGFWVNLPDTKGVPWDLIHKNIFPNIQRNWSKDQNKHWLYARMKMINDLRNRISHWEPIWKLGPLNEESRPRPGKAALTVLQPPTSNPKESLVRLMSYYDRMRSILSGIDSDLAMTYDDSYAHKAISWICSEQGLATYRSNKKNIEIPLHEVKKQLNKVVKDKQHVTITVKGRPLAVVHPL